MYNVDDFNTYIKEAHGKNYIFIMNNQIQDIVNTSPVCTLETMNTLIDKVMDNEFHLDSLSSFVSYDASYDEFKKAFIKYPYNRFNYFFCNSLCPANNLTAAERTVIYFPLKYREAFYKKLCKLANLKAFL